MIGKNIKKLRVEKGLKQQELADLLGLSQGSIALIEGDKSKITIDSLILLCQKLDVSADKLLFDIDGVSEGELELIRKYRKLSEREKGRIDEILKD